METTSRTTKTVCVVADKEKPERFVSVTVEIPAACSGETSPESDMVSDLAMDLAKRVLAKLP